MCKISKAKNGDLNALVTILDEKTIVWNGSKKHGYDFYDTNDQMNYERHEYQ